MYDNNNIFAKILRGEIPSKKILYPQAKVHILGIPKMKVVDFGDFVIKADTTIVKNFFFKIYEIAQSVKINKTGYKIITNSGKDGGQEVQHFHVHILGGEKLDNFK